MKITLYTKSICLKVSIVGLFLLLNVVAAWSQRTITGTISDADNNDPMVGASVVVTGTTQGSIADIDGKYSVDVPSGATSLTISFAGYTSQIVNIGASNVINIALKAGTVLDQVVVVGYGTAKVKEVTGAVASVRNEDFNKGNVTSPAELIQGKVAGATVTTTSSDPNGGIQIKIRGYASVRGSSDPLYVIDGVIDADPSTVLPTDIESVDVLKDGSAAAIYGQRATNGVVIITTKKGKKGETRVDYSSTVSTQRFANVLPVLEKDAYLAAVLKYKGQGNVSDFGSNTDWFKAITREKENFSTIQNISVSGGGEKTTYRGAINYSKQQGIALKSGFDQVNARLDISQKAINDRLKIDIGLIANTKEKSFINYSAFRYASFYNPTAPIYAKEGEMGYGANFGGFFRDPTNQQDNNNPFAEIAQIDNRGIENTLTGNYRATLDLIPNEWSISAFGSTQRKKNQYLFYASKFYQGTNDGGQNLNNEQKDLYEYTTTYNKEFAKHNVKILGGYSYQYQEFQGFGASSRDFTFDYTGADNLSFGTQKNNAVYSYRNDNRLISVFSRVNYSFDDTYLLMASIRREGCSKFGANNKWGNFPAVSAGVRLTKFIKSKNLDDLKFRAGYGETGNQGGIGSYESLLQVGSNGTYFNGTEFINAFGIGRIENKNLKWEVKKETNIGVDFELFNYRLGGSVDVYNRKTIDLLYDFPVSIDQTGVSTYLDNAGSMVNRGIEIGLHGTPITNKNFKWNVNFTASYNQNKILQLGKGDLTKDSLRFGDLGVPALVGIPSHILIKNAPYVQFYGLIYTGNDSLGKAQYKDLNEDKKIDDKDRTVIGTGIPKYTFGLANTFTYKEFDFNIFLRAVTGQQVLNGKRMFFETTDRLPRNILASTLEGEVNTSPSAMSSRYIEDGSFLRIDNASLGYTWKPSEKAQKYVKSLRVSLTAQNIYNFTKYKGFDPEVNVDGFTLGYDDTRFYPRTRTFSFGLNASF